MNTDARQIMLRQIRKMERDGKSEQQIESYRRGFVRTDAILSDELRSKNILRGLGAMKEAMK